MIKKNYSRLIAEAYQRFISKKRMNYDLFYFDKITMTEIYFNERVYFSGEREFQFGVSKNGRDIFNEYAIPEIRVIRIAKLVEIFGN